jgi:hypothetical protein
MYWGQYSESYIPLNELLTSTVKMPETELAQGICLLIK